MKCQTVLFTPADQVGRVSKAWATGAADIVVADLEDAILPSDKEAARNGLHVAFEGDAACLRAVRINVWPSRTGDADLAALVPLGPELIVVPKAEDPDAITALDVRLGELEAAAGREEGEIRLLLLLETAAGVLHGSRLAAASPRVVAVAFGAEDLAADVGIQRSNDNAEIAVPRALVPLHAATVGVAAIDMITADYQDAERTRREAQEARALGYRGKMCLHPAQVEAVRDAFCPSAEEVAWASRVHDASKKGGVVVVDGRMIDAPLVAQAERILADASQES